MNGRDLNASVILPNLIVLMLVAVGLVGERVPLVSVRPESASSPSDHAVRARLWEDPFAIKPPEKPPTNLGELITDAQKAKKTAFLERKERRAGEKEAEIRTL